MFIIAVKQADPPKEINFHVEHIYGKTEITTSKEKPLFTIRIQFENTFKLMFNFTPKDYILKFKGQQLDESREIRSYGIDSGSTINLEFQCIFKNLFILNRSKRM
jgi:hypothetical protein